MSADNLVVVKMFPDGWRWAEVRGDVPVIDDDFINGPFGTCFDAQDDARDKIEVIEYGVEILRPAELMTVELHIAFTWTCDDCGMDNYVRSINVEMDEHQAFHERDRMGISQEGGGTFCTMPRGVTCHSCGARFVVQQAKDDE